MSGPYRYTECGLDDVWLANGFTRHDTPYGPGVAIDDVDGLHRAIARRLVHARRPLAGKEVRFLRKELDLAQEGLAALLGCTGQTVARWEKGETAIPGAADRLVRLLYLEREEGRPRIQELLEALAEEDASRAERQLFEAEHGWRPAA